MMWNVARRKLRKLTLAQIGRLLLPQPVDELLYEIEVDPRLYVQSPENELRIQRYDKNLKSGYPSIDNRLTCRCECYTGQIGTDVVHESWLFYDVFLPSQFGFDSTVPVIGDCVTDSKKRGKHIYSKVLRHIAFDIAAREISRKLYILVSPNNISSKRGIERAGFCLIAHLQGSRLGGLILKKSIILSGPNT